MRVKSGWWLGALAGAMLAGPAQAAPYCVVQLGITTQCLYFDPAECKQRANQLGGNCAANPSELALPTTSTTYPYCIAGPGYSSCKFVDRGACEAEAARLGVGCVEGVAPAGPNAPPDPYRDLFVTGR